MGTVEVECMMGLGATNCWRLAGGILEIQSVAWLTASELRWIEAARYVALMCRRRRKAQHLPDKQGYSSGLNWSLFSAIRR